MAKIDAPFLDYLSDSFIYFSPLLKDKLNSSPLSQTINLNNLSQVNTILIKKKKNLLYIRSTKNNISFRNIKLINAISLKYSNHSRTSHSKSNPISNL